jgi:hypothetical protein
VDVVAIANNFVAVGSIEQALQNFFALLEGKSTNVMSIKMKQVENKIG